MHLPETPAWYAPLEFWGTLPGLACIWLTGCGLVLWVQWRNATVLGPVRHRIPWTTLGILALVLLGGGGIVSVLGSLGRKSDLAQMHRRVDAAVQTFETVKATNGRIVAALASSPEMEGTGARLDSCLDRYAGMVPQGHAYAMDRKGIARQADSSGRAALVGGVYGLRPYFREALAGRASSYLAVGMSIRRGALYCAAPVAGRSKAHAVVALRQSLQSWAFFDSTASQEEGRLFLVSPEGVILSASDSAAFLHRLWESPAGRVDSAVAARQYPEPVKDAGILPSQPRDGERLVADGGVKLVVRAGTTLPGWSFVLVDVPRSEMLLRLWVLCLVVGAASVVVVLQLLQERHLVRAMDIANIAREAQRKAVCDRARFEAMFHGSPLAVLLTDLDSGVVEDVNRAFEEQLGWSRAEILGKTTAQVGIWMDPVERGEHLGAVARDGNRVSEARFRDRSGNMHWLQVHSSQVILEGQDFVINQVQDVTDMREAMARIRQSEERFRQLFENVSAGFCLVEPLCSERGSVQDFRFLELNDSLAQLLRIERADLCGMRASEAGQGMVSSENLELCTRVLATGRSQTLEFSSGWMGKSIQLTAFLPQEGLLGLLVEDVSERKRWEEALVEALNRANEATKAKSAFLANMSHEIRTPMNGVMGMAEMLLDTPLNPEQREGAQTLARSAEALLTIINDILDFSKIEAGHLQFETIDFDLEDVFRDMRGLFGHLAGSRGIGLDLKLEDGTPRWLRGDPLRIRQILTNVVGNAIKFTPAGSVQVRARLLERQGSRVRLVVEVRDTGIGIPADRIGLLFKPFSQTDNSMTRRFGGTGLGLSISQRLAELMGGVITVESQEGKGSTFRIELSLLEVDEPSHSLPVVGAAKAAFDGHVLLVEDNATNQRIALRLLERMGLTVSIAGNGIEALGALATESFDAVLMDVQMPEMDGLEATVRLRADVSLGANRSIPVIAMTAHAMRGDRELCLQAGMDDYLTKPIRSEELRQVLANWLAKDAT